ncbi:MAG: hypothetical protein AB1634_09915 [Thermodesulfobacteriota bacterium]
MRRLARLDLPSPVADDLAARQDEADRKRRAASLLVSEEWKAARASRTLKSVLAVLRRMTGDRERCMYCLDSHGSDIEHFWPKMRYPERMFLWPNLLLCCADCGRLKGNRFPLSTDARPLLIDPTAEDPWLDLDFDPPTGNLVARFDPVVGDYSAKGQHTVATLQLDRREALAVGYRRTFRRLAALVERHLSEPGNKDDLARALADADDHGLLGWCFLEAGQGQTPFRTLRQQDPEAWQACAAVARGA